MVFKAVPIYDVQGKGSVVSNSGPSHGHEYLEGAGIALGLAAVALIGTVCACNWKR